MANFILRISLLTMYIHLRRIKRLLSQISLKKIKKNKINKIKLNQTIIKEVINWLLMAYKKYKIIICNSKKIQIIVIKIMRKTVIVIIKNLMKKE